MNTLVAILLLRCVFQIFKKHISPHQQKLIFLGVFIPVGDQFLRLFWGEIWYQTGQLYFHSLFYNAIFWITFVSLHWICTRSIKRSLQYLLPLGGLLTYFLLSFFSTGSNYFFSPFTIQRFHRNWIANGYLIPLFIFVFPVFLEMIKIIVRKIMPTDSSISHRHFSFLQNRIIIFVQISLFVTTVGTAGILKAYIHQSLPKELKEGQHLNIYPAGHFLFNWLVVASRENQYKWAKYSFWKKEKLEIFSTFFSNEPDSVLTQLNDPRIYNILTYLPVHPVVHVEIHNSGIILTIEELTPLDEIAWLKQIVIKKNRAGQILEISTQYAIWEQLFESSRTQLL